MQPIYLERITCTRTAKVPYARLSRRARAHLSEVGYSPSGAVSAPWSTVGRDVITVAGLIRAGWLELDVDQWMIRLKAWPNE